MKYKNWFDWNKAKNEKTYGEYCGHRDRSVVSGGEGFIITCRTCGASGTRDTQSYDIELPKTRLEK